MIYSCVKTKFTLTCIIVLLSLSSCVSKEKVIYFQNAKDFETIVDTDTFSPKFKVNDIISIYVSTFDLDVVRPFNLSKDGGNSTSTEFLDYLIDNEGNISGLF